MNMIRLEGKKGNMVNLSDLRLNLTLDDFKLN